MNGKACEIDRFSFLVSPICTVNAYDSVYVGGVLEAGLILANRYVSGAANEHSTRKGVYCFHDRNVTGNMHRHIFALDLELLHLSLTIGNVSQIYMHDI